MVVLKYLQYNVIVLRTLTMYKIDKSAGLSSKVFYYFARVLFNVGLILFLFGLIMDVERKGPFEFGATALSYGYISAIANSMLRTIYYSVYGDQTERLVLRMNEFFKYATETLLKERSMKNCVAISNKIALAWLIYGLLVNLPNIFASVLFNTGSEERKLPVSMWLPYAWQTSPYYEMTYFFQVCVLYLMILIHISTEMFFTCSLLLTTEQFKLLGWELKNSLYTGLIGGGMSKEFVRKIARQFNNFADVGEADSGDFVALCDVCKSEEFGARMLNKLNDLIEFHANLLTFCSDLNDFFSPTMLALFFDIVPLTIFINFVIILVKDASLVFCLMISASAYTTVFISCFVANFLSNQAEELRKELYELPWYMCDKKCKISVQIMLQKMNTSVFISVGKFSQLNLQLFLWFVRTVNSYCIVLYQLTQLE